MHPTADSQLMPKDKNSLAIRLTESAVFLRSDGSTRTHAHTQGGPSLVRGLLILNLVKPTKISGIEIHLLGKSETYLAEGVGTRRIDINERHRFFRASTTYFDAGKVHSRRAVSIGPGVAYNPYHGDSFEELHASLNQRHPDDDHDGEQDHTSHEDPPIYRRRNASVDAPHYQPRHISYHEEPLPLPPYAPSPPYSSSSHAPSPFPSPYSLTRNASPAESQEEFRAGLNDAVHEPNTSNLSATFIPSRVTSTQSYRFNHPDSSISSHPGTDDVPEEAHQSTRRGSWTPPHPDDPDHDRGRRKNPNRFTLATVSHALIDAVRSSSPMLARSRESSRDSRGNMARGRPVAKRSLESVASPTSYLNPRSEMEKPKVKTQKDNLLDKVGEMLKLDGAEHKEAGKDWKEFKKGVYTYPISFQVPADSPPTMACDYGAVIWSLHARVHRPGAFRTRYTAEREVVVVSCPTEDDIEENENIIVERHWDHQLQYLIAISGRSFYIGGTLPVTFTMLPMTKAKVYRVAVYLEERVDYYTCMRKIARSDPVKRSELVCIRDPSQSALPILPLNSDDPEAFLKSPFYNYVSSELENEDEISQMASDFMGPGPWKFHLDLKLPQSCTALRPTNQNKRANITVTHLLKIVMRMERGDNMYVDKNGKKKLYDVVVQTPVHILSCRCNPELTSLPRYSESLHPVDQIAHRCPCRTNTTHHNDVEQSGMYRAQPEHVTSRESIGPGASPTGVNPVAMASLRGLRRDDLVVANTLFERLVSGQQTEMGETPPAYEDTST